MTHIRNCWISTAVVGAGKILAVCMLPLLSTGCATIISGKTQHVRVTSEPPGAHVVVEPGGIEATTPADLVLSRSAAPYLLTIKKDGFEPYQGILRSANNGWAFGNVVFIGTPPIIGMLIGAFVDAGTGAQWSLSPGSVDAPLRKVPEALNTQKTDPQEKPARSIVIHARSKCRFTSDTAFAEQLRQSLQNAGIFSSVSLNGAADLILDVEALGNGYYGLATEIHVITTWTLRDSGTQRVLSSESFQKTQNARPGERFGSIGLIRNALAEAMRDNIEQGTRKLALIPLQ